MLIIEAGRRCPIFKTICTNEECRGNGKQGICKEATDKFIVRAEFISVAANKDINRMSNVARNVISDDEAVELGKIFNIDAEIIKTKVAENIFIIQHSIHK